MQEIFYTFMDILNEKTIVSYSIVLIFGLLIGSFLNVVIYRLPVMMNLEFLESIKDVTSLSDETITSKMSPEEKNEYNTMMSMKGINLSFPRSRCGACNQKIKMWHNIPVISYLMLRGKCSSCSIHYSPRYLFIELFIGLFWCFSFYQFGLSIEFLIITPVFTALIASLFIDLDHKLLPDSITYASLFAGLFYSTASEMALTTPQYAILGVILGYLGIFIVVKTYEKLRGIGMMMGDGDLKLYAMCGAWIGFYNLSYLILLSTVLGLLQFLLLTPFLKNIKNHELPFGPAILVSLFFFIYFNEYTMNTFGSIFN